MSQTLTLEYALRYASLGWPILPIAAVAKSPLVNGGVHAASTDPAVIGQWFEKYPDANVAVRPVGYLVIDIDPRNGGFESWKKVASQYGNIGHTPRQRTGGGGGHILVKSELTQHRSKLPSGLQGIDILGGTRYWLAYPSKHPSGRQYEWLADPWSTPLAHIPDWLVNLIKVDPPLQTEPPYCAQLEVNETVIDRARNYLNKIPGAISGQGGNAATFFAAQSMTRGFGLSENQAMRLMRDWNQSCRPPWSEPALRKLIRASTKGNMSLGKLRG